MYNDNDVETNIFTGGVTMVECKDCAKIKEWSFSENVVAFCPVAQKYVKKDEGCEKGEKKD